MNNLPCQGCKGLCCGPVPVTEKELKKIKKKVRSMPPRIRSNLQNQPRHFGTCIFYDLDQDRCGIHSVRPEVCRAFGYHKNLVCFRNPAAATEGTWMAEDMHVGLLTVDITWKDFS
ncbi:YkgJ family cysteine cluster protein [Alicyclobacillus dauci]|uniref:YkgJ family cysteine cluster protein n=1 Tax=Alicyclobacillus dauci TaxID=1475485 RepID=A0ABY6Z4W6_9BACL|nr:YkgJ family cysteine cluster protein [Alicyclobacillus dauci]WAH37909.1 YkgJ family cysteine cluster protein [Alicyclobacillus dauci]